MKFGGLTSSLTVTAGAQQPRWQEEGNIANPPRPILYPLRSTLHVVTVWILSSFFSIDRC